MAELYQKYLAGGPIEYMTSVFGEITGSNDAAKQLALEFYGPMFLLYGLSDGGDGQSARDGAAGRSCEPIYRPDGSRKNSLRSR